LKKKGKARDVSSNDTGVVYKDEDDEVEEFVSDEDEEEIDQMRTNLEE
jgi:hypothetical protein